MVAEALAGLIQWVILSVPPSVGWHAAHQQTERAACGTAAPGGSFQADDVEDLFSLPFPTSASLRVPGCGSPSSRE